MYRISFYSPADVVEAIKEAMFSVGAGSFGSYYDKCSWETRGVGQFRPLRGSRPAIGIQDNLELVEEVKVEMCCVQSKLADAIRALIATHPYEVPVYGIEKIGTLEDVINGLL